MQEEAELYAVLPPELKQRVRKELQSFCLTQAPLFQGVSPAARQTLLVRLHWLGLNLRLWLLLAVAAAVVDAAAPAAAAAAAAVAAGG